MKWCQIYGIKERHKNMVDSRNVLEIHRESNKQIEKEIKNMEKVMISTLATGSRFKTDIGTFIVLEQLEGATKVIMEGLYRENVEFDDNTPDYKVAAVRNMFDSDIFEEFAQVFGGDNIIEHEVDLTTVDMQKDYGEAVCKVRPLTFDEVRKYNDMLVNRNLPDWWWTCTPWSVKGRGWSYCVAVVSPAGGIDNFNCDYHFGVRPFCILKSNILVSVED